MAKKNTINPWTWQDRLGFSHPSFGPRLAAANCKPSSTLLVVGGLFHAQLMIEIEATAVV